MLAVDGAERGQAGVDVQVAILIMFHLHFISGQKGYFFVRTE
jgi:hypothetical protein